MMHRADGGSAEGPTKLVVAVLGLRGDPADHRVLDGLPHLVSLEISFGDTGLVAVAVDKDPVPRLVSVTPPPAPVPSSPRASRT